MPSSDGPATIGLRFIVNGVQVDDLYTVVTSERGSPLMTINPDERAVDEGKFLLDQGRTEYMETLLRMLDYRDLQVHGLFRMFERMVMDRLHSKDGVGPAEVMRVRQLNPHFVMPRWKNGA